MITDWIDKIHSGDSLEVLKKIPDNTVNLVICSPPYFQQRQYTDNPKEVGRENNIVDYLEALHKIFVECMRVVREDGSVVFNIGDKYIDGDLMLIPFQFALMVKKHKTATLINEVTWVKSNPTPRQFDRRMVSSTEPFFHFVKTKKYYYCTECLVGSPENKVKSDSKVGQGYYKQIEESELSKDQKELAKKELGEIIEEVRAGKLASLRMKIKGKHSLPFGGQEGGRLTQIKNKGFSIIRVPGKTMLKDWMESPVETIHGIKHSAIYPRKLVENFVALTTQENDIVLDPFIGSGTTALVCKSMNRHYIGIELNEEFVIQARNRVNIT